MPGAGHGVCPWLSAVDRNATPHNEQGQAPTHSASETQARLEEKSDADRGRANNERIRTQISKISAQND